jgi:hypothetical protein
VSGKRRWRRERLWIACRAACVFVDLNAPELGIRFSRLSVSAAWARSIARAAGEHVVARRALRKQRLDLAA